MYGDATTPANQFGSQAGEAWAAGNTGSQAVYVAVIDEGIDITHPDLAPNIWTNPFDPVNGADDDGNGRIDDVHGWDFRNNDNSVYDGPGDDHGTHVAGTIGARGGNAAGVAGVNWNVTIISAKFLSGTGSTDHAIQALDYIVDLKTRHGLNIIATNNSWGGGGASVALHQAMIRAAKQGILFIAAAGNGGDDGVGDDNDVTPHYPSNYSTLVAAGSESPATYEAVISVAALTSSGARSSFSNYGATSVDIGAPGSAIYSTWPGGGYQAINGTSMATPHVTGAAALYKSGHPGATAEEIRDAILAFGIPTPSMTGITTTGKRLNAGEFGTSLSLSINDTARAEGNAGPSNAVFSVSLSTPSASPVSVRYSTVDVTAFGGRPANANAITIPSFGPSPLYPSTITVPAGMGTVTGMRVVLNGFSHSWPDDVDILLVGPGGQKVVLMSDVGGSVDVSDATLTFDDAGAALPDSIAIASGTYQPTNFEGTDTFSAPAPGGPYASALAAFNGTTATGTWSLFVTDDTGGDSGSIARGWTLEVTTSAGADYVATAGIVTFPPGSTSQPLPIAILGDLIAESSETFRVVLSDPSGAAIADGEAIGTIVNDDFTDLSLGGLPIRAVHIVELRAAINELRAARGLAPFTFTDAALTPQSNTIRAVHIVELRAAVIDVYEDAGVTPPAFTDPSIVPGVTVIKAAHILEIRAAIVNSP
jgi:subtilisin-like proprotein convertase family protein